MGLAAATVFAIGTTAPGPGLDPDAQSYLGAAISLARSGSYRVPTSSWAVADTSEPLTHFPPGFSTLIAAPIALGVSPLQAGRMVVVVAAGATWAGLVALIALAAGVRTGLIVGLAALCTPALVTLHLSILSEPPFLTALVVVLAGMWALSESPAPWRAFATGLGLAGAVMLRYVGVSLGVAAVWWGVIGQARARLSPPQRAGRAALLVAPAAATLVPWLLRSVHVGGPASVRQFGAYGDLGATARDGLETIAAWIVPVGIGSWRFAVAGLVLVGVGLMARSVWQRVSRTAAGNGETAPAVVAVRRAERLLAIIGSVAGAYVTFIITSRVLADPNIPFDERILAPVLLLGEIAIALVIGIWWRGRRRLTRVAVAVGVLAWFVASGVVSVQRIAFARDDGNDFAGSDWRDSPTIAWVRSPRGGGQRTLYSNWPAALYFQAHRSSHDLPATLDRLALHRFRERLARSHGVVVGFTTASPDVASPDSVARLLGLRQIARFDDGSVWEMPQDDSEVLPVADNRRRLRTTGDYCRRPPPSIRMIATNKFNRSR
jgi:hypothetical protein